jgi:hypothetical protein
MDFFILAGLSQQPARTIKDADLCVIVLLPWLTDVDFEAPGLRLILAAVNTAAFFCPGFIAPHTQNIPAKPKEGFHRIFSRILCEEIPYIILGGKTTSNCD